MTVNVKVKALAQTTVGATYYSFHDLLGQVYDGSVLGKRTPALAYKSSLAAGRTAQGWVTMMIPKTRFERPDAHVPHAGRNGPTLVVPLSIR